MDYHPGTHIIATFTADPQLLQVSNDISVLLNELIATYQLQKLGDVYHDFPDGGYTAVVCLSESHISLHTWPEHGLVNLDIYLSNFLRNNDGTVQGIYQSLVKFYNATILHELILQR